MVDETTSALAAQPPTKQNTGKTTAEKTAPTKNKKQPAASRSGRSGSKRVGSRSGNSAKKPGSRSKSRPAASRSGRSRPRGESNRVSAQLRKQASEGKISRKNAAQKIVEMQQANTMAHIEKSVKEGKTTRAEADALLKKLGYK